MLTRARFAVFATLLVAYGCALGTPTTTTGTPKPTREGGAVSVLPQITTPPTTRAELPATQAPVASKAPVPLATSAQPTPTPTPQGPPSPRPSLAPLQLQEVSLPDAMGVATRHRYLVASAVSQRQPKGVTLALGAGSAYHTLSAPAPVAVAPGGLCGGLGRAHDAPPRLARQLQALSLGAEQRFEVDPGRYGVPDAMVTGKLVASGQQLAVFMDTNLPAAQAATVAARAQEMATAFDGSIHAADTRVFGAGPGAAPDGDGRLYVLISPAVDNNGKAGIPGFFVPWQVHPVVYIAASQVLSYGQADYLGTVAHEYQHVINYQHHVLDHHGAQEDWWLDEGLAMYAMQANQYGLGSGADVFAYQIKLYCGGYRGYSLTNWDGNPGGVGYGAAYLFVQYLVDRFGEGVVTTLAKGDREGAANLDAALLPYGSSFAEAQRDWALANLAWDRGAGTDPRVQYPGFSSLVPYLQPHFDAQALDAGASLPLALAPYTFALYQLPDAARYDLGQAVGVDSGAPLSLN